MNCNTAVNNICFDLSFNQYYVLISKTMLCSHVNFKYGNKYYKIEQLLYSAEFFKALKINYNNKESLIVCTAFIL